ncbi:MAG TPA: amino acid adenylation domain-containing protein [Longimicrobium sp.]|nr:amino acid adenylation domain-containing protein [Longimicrobium sp.]
MPTTRETPSAPRTHGAGAEPAPPARSEVEAWNRTDAAYPADRCIHQLFEEQAAATPHAMAVVLGDASLTYHELDALAGRIARRLVRLGVGPEVRVGICLERSLEMVAAILAVLKAGGAYVPLDPGDPPERLAFVLADSGVAVLLADDATRGAVPPHPGVAAVNVARLLDEADAGSADGPGIRVGPGALAYVMYTSGSTGTPKGVGVEHRGVVRLVRGATYAELGPGEVILQGAPISFDASTFELWGALLNGGRLVLVRGSPPTLEALGRAIREHGVTTLWLTAGLFRVMVQERLEDLRGVRHLLVGGDVVPVPEMMAVRARFPACRVINGYGPTENTTFTCCYTVPQGWSGAAIPIGHPISNTRAYLLDEAMRPVAAGAAGELCAGGDGVARGYLGRPAATAERFVPDPFSGAAGARLYRTGDRARRNERGEIEFLGRLDRQVKVRGFRIEPGEVEAALLALPGVAAAAVVVHGRGEDAALVAYVAGAGGAPSADALREALGARLPGYMVPGRIVALDSIPLTASGKVDRGALPVPPRAPDAERHVAPRSAVEAAVAAIWAEVLGVERVGVATPFLELGGHSLRGVRVIARIAEAYGVEIAPHVLLRSGTVEEVAALVEAAERAAPAVRTAPALERVPRDGPLPLSFSQEQAWFFEQLVPGTLAYSAQATIRLAGALDAPALERSLSEMVRRHEIFRTTFGAEHGEPAQRIHPPWRVQLPARDLAGLGAAARAAAVDDAVRAEFHRPFDTAALPLARWTLLRLSAEEHLLLVVEHHFVHDGWSFTLFFRELREIYLAYTEGRASPLAEPAVQFADFAVWQRRWMESDVGQAKLRWWEEALAGLPPLVLPTDFPRPTALRHRGAAERVQLPPARVAEARAFSRAHGVTFFVTLLAAFQALLGRWSGQRDFAVGSALGNRGQVALEGVIGMVVNTVALRADLGGDPTAAELLLRVRDTTLGAFEHQDVPFLQVVKRIHPERSSGALPVCQVAFSFQNSQMPDLSFGAVRLEFDEALNNGSAKFDLQVVAIPRGEQGMAEVDEVVLVWEYNTDLFAAATVRRMVRHFETLLAGMVREPGRRLSGVEMMGADERRVVLEEWNRTEAAAAPEACVHWLVEAQVARTPGAVALVFEDESLTYRELEGRANRLARHLVRLGAAPESTVGICLERSAAMVVAMLAVLKSGAAYLPLDPAYPAERLAYMLEDSGAAVLVTQASLRGLLPAAGARIVSVDADADAIAAEPADAPPAAVSAGNAAYVIYTSGSTGRPKGVQVTHASGAAFFAGMDGRVGGTVPGTWLAVTRISFDIHVLELLWTLARGFRVIVHPEAREGREEVTPAARIRRDGVTHLQCTPSLAAMMIAESGAEALAGLDRLLLGGEALPASLAAQVGAVLPGRLVNLYGPTETTVWSATHAVTEVGGTVPIGRPIAGTRVYVLDERFRPQPVGVPGELCIAGAGVARGYLHRPGLTADRFRPDPFAPRPGARLYRTGDRARWRADGVLEYLGRLDEQVKIRGFRIEPGEIEAVLRAHPAVRDCAVVARAETGGETRLAACVVAAAPDAAGPAELRAWLRGKLPEHMVPATVAFVDRLPLLPNGKLDRASLPAAGPAPAADAGPSAPAAGAEGGIARIWQDLLGRERVASHEDFFELGGDSLLATRVVLRTRDLLGREVPLVSLFDHRTLAAFALAACASLPIAADDDLLAGFDEPLEPLAAPGGVALEGGCR